MNVNRRDILQLLAIGGLGLTTLRPNISLANISTEVIIPPRLKRGDVIGLVSPAGITRSRDKLSIIEETLAELDLKLHVDEHAMDRWGYLAGKDEVRAEAINKMYSDSGVDAILTFIVGWGCARLICIALSHCRREQFPSHLSRGRHHLYNYRINTEYKIPYRYDPSR